MKHNIVSVLFDRYIRYCHKKLTCNRMERSVWLYGLDICIKMIFENSQFHVNTLMRSIIHIIIFLIYDQNFYISLKSKILVKSMCLLIHHCMRYQLFNTAGKWCRYIKRGLRSAVTSLYNFGTTGGLWFRYFGCGTINSLRQYDCYL